MHGSGDIDAPVFTPTPARRTEDAAVLFDTCAAWVLEGEAASSSAGLSNAQALLESPLCHFTR